MYDKDDDDVRSDDSEEGNIGELVFNWRLLNRESNQTLVIYVNTKQCW